MSRRLKLLLTLSLLLNILLASVLAAHMARHVLDAHPMAEAIAPQLPPDQRAHFMEIIGPLEAEDLLIHEQMHRNRETLHSMLLAEPFDKTAYLRTQQEMQDQQGQRMKHSAELLVSVASQLSAQERGLLVDYLNRSHHGACPDKPNAPEPIPVQSPPINRISARHDKR